MAKLASAVTVDTTTRTPLDVAHSYVRRGVPVFPCRSAEEYSIDPNTGEYVTFKEKTPLTSTGLNGASRTPRIIDIWFGERHPTAAIGVPTGDHLGAWVLDLDRHGDRDGHAWLAEMEAKHGSLPDTARAATANGGTHIFFRHVEGVRNRAAIAPGVDTRGEGGYILAPGSVMSDGRSYAWVSGDLDSVAEAPQWLLDMVIARPQPTTQAPATTPYTHQPAGNTIYVERAVERELAKAASAPPGQRGQQLFASACALGEFVAAGVLSRHEAEAGLYQAAVSCGVRAKDGERETLSRIKRGLDRTQASPRAIPESATAEDLSAYFDADKLANKPPRSAPAPAAANDDTPAEPAPDPKKRARFDLTWFDDIEETAPKETIIRGVLGVQEFTTVSGLPGTGKSVIVTDMACHVAAGRDWHGRRVRQGLVVYVAAERKKLTERRMMAFRQRHEVKDVPLLVVGGRLDFTSSLKDARDLIGAIREAEMQTGEKCVWVIIDTLTRVFGPGDQNTSKDMGRFVQSCDEVSLETGAHVTAIHHTAWSGERGKGAIDLDGAVDASFMVKKDGGKHRLVCDGTNDGEEGDIVSFTMDSVRVGVDEDGEPTTAPVVVPAVSETVKLKPDSEIAKGHDATVLQALHDALSAEAVQPDGPHFPEGVMVVAETSWREAAYASFGNNAPQPTLNKRFNRAKGRLIEAGVVGEIGQWVWPI